ncbi:unnamed protein product, partial [Cladocopium goreaui]
MGQEVASLDQAFDELVERFPMRPAVEDDDGCVMSYRQLQEASRRIAAGMAQLCRGQDAPIVALLMRRNCNWLAASLATMRLGTLLALSCDLGGDDEERRNCEAMAEHQPRLLVLERSAAVPSLFTTSAVAYVEDLLRTEECFVERPRRHLDDAVYLVYTGGTTAASKCVVQTHRMALHELRTYADFQALSCEDRILHHTSAFWGAACHGMMDLAWSCGACLVMLSRHGVNEVARAISERNITVAGIVPSLLDALDDKRCQSLRCSAGTRRILTLLATIAGSETGDPGDHVTTVATQRPGTVFTWGEPLRQTTLEFWRTRVQLLDLLIASEYWLVLYADHRRSGGGFRPVPGARLTLLSCAAEDASSLSKVVEVAPGEVGELYIAGAMVSAQGYTKASFNEGAFLELPVGPGGSMLRHYRTRDLARVLPDGTLEYCGRADGFAKVGGKWLDLASVERSLQSAGCREASLLWDEVTKVRHACVVPNQLHKPMAAAVQTWQALVPPQTRALANRACAKSGEWKQAIALLQELLEVKNLELDVVPFAAAINACTNGQEWLPALLILSEVNSVQVEVNVITYNSAISACEKSGEWQKAFDLLHAMPKQQLQAGMLANPLSLPLFKTLRKYELIQASTAFLMAMYFFTHAALVVRKPLLFKASANHGLEEPEEAAAAATGGSCRNCCNRVEGEKVSKWSLALQLFDDLRQRELEASLISYNSTISACAKSGEWQRALALLEDADATATGCDVISYNAAITACSNAAEWDHALSLLRALNLSRLKANLITYNAMLGGCRSVQEVWTFIEEAESLGLNPNMITYGAAISACDRLGESQQALLLLQHLTVGRLRCNVIACSAAISACEKCAEWQNALRLMQMMKDKEIEAHVISYNALISAVGSAESAWQKATQVFEELRDRLQADVFSYSSAISACGICGQWEE